MSLVDQLIQNAQESPQVASDTERYILHQTQEQN